MIDWMDMMGRITYDEAKRQNWPRPTCRYCHSPTAYDREFRAQGLCQSCYQDEQPPLITVKKELLPCPPTLPK